MDEAEWLASEDPAAMLRWVQQDDGPVARGHGLPHPPLSERKLRLWAEAAGPCDLCLGFGRDESRTAAEYAEFVAGSACLGLREKAALLRDIAGNPFRSVTLKRPLPFVATSLAEAAYEERLPDGTLDPVRLAVLADALEEAGCEGERCRYGNGFDHSSCGGCDGSGSASHPILAHLRSPGPHVRGCWAVDMILGRE